MRVVGLPLVRGPRALPGQNGALGQHEYKALDAERQHQLATDLDVLEAT